MLKLHRDIVTFAKQTRIIRDRMMYQLVRKQGKIAFLTGLWNQEKNEMKSELIKLKDKASKELYLKLCLLSEETAVKFIHLYIQRCSFKYQLAFFQWRSTLSGAHISNLEEIFNARLFILADSIRKANLLGGQINSELSSLKKSI